MFNTMDSDVQLTTSAGTPAFMAPECLDCKCVYQPTTLYCMCVCYISTLLFSNLVISKSIQPFSDQHFMQFMYKIL